MKLKIHITLLFASFLLLAEAQIPRETQIENALLVLPQNLRNEATVLGYNAQNKVEVIREGSNHMICLADDPTKEGFSVAAYHKDLEPFMARGRELKAQGKSFQEVFDTREAEVKSGQLKMPDKATLIVVTGDLDENGSPTNTFMRYVVYIPFATSESTGLPEGPMSNGGPWIMNPGTHRAHIMITPPK